MKYSMILKIDTIPQAKYLTSRWFFFWVDFKIYIGNLVLTTELKT